MIEKMEQPIAEQALRALGVLVGEWSVEAKGADGEPWPGEARAIFEWHPSNAHLIQRTATDVEGAPDSTAIIGCDGAKGTFVQLYSDERGVCRVYSMDISDTEWLLQRDGDPFAQRFVGTFSEDARTISGRWEKSGDGVNFELDFSLTYRRID
jgi:hypothetical protein